MPVIILLWFPALITIIDLLAFLFTGKRIIKYWLLLITEIGAMIILPLLYGNFGKTNDCCADNLDTAVFSPGHQLTIGVVIFVCIIAYFYSGYRKTIASPIIEIIVNALPLTGIILNVFIAIHTKESWLAIGGNVPVIILAVLVLVKNQQLFMVHADNLKLIPINKLERIAWQILHLKPFVKIPVILILCLPVLVIITAILLIFGQKADSIIRAFTDTYKHGLSQWDYKCDNVQCGGHYLCSVAAKGHKKVVKPQRFGVRNGGKIVCNRQLLIANAFEEILQERCPVIHTIIRKQYNKAGHFIHRYYIIFNIRLISDAIYFLMKPLELLFLLTLYTFDKKPEDRIARQYLSDADRQTIERCN